VKNHHWFKDFEWEALQSGAMPAPFMPSADNENFDKNHVNN